MSVVEIGCSKPGELATVVEVDSDGDFRLWYSGGLAVVLLRDISVYVAPSTPQQSVPAT